MLPQSHRSPGRLLAPAALVAVFVALLMIVLGSSGASGPETSGSTFTAREAAKERATRPTREGRAVYTVKGGDTLGAIAESTGTTVERLGELNPDLDARTLVAGQKIKLRR